MTQRGQGAVLLSRTGQTQDAIAERVAVSRVAVSHWLSGTTKPSAKKRAVLLEAYGIDLHVWDEVTKKREKKEPTAAPPVASSAPSAPSAPSPPPVSSGIPSDIDGKARMLEDMVVFEMQALRDDPESTPLERAKVMASVAATLNLLAKLTGQFDIGARLFRLPIWKRIERALDEGLRAYPAAAASVARALRAAAEEHPE